MPEESTDITTFNPDSIAVNRENGFEDLETKRKAFCVRYITNGYDHREAAEHVGFSRDKGIVLKREPLIAAYISDLMKQYVAESLVTKQTLDSYLDELEDIAMGRISVPMLTPTGDEIEAKKFHPDLAMKIYTEKAKLHGIVKEDERAGAAVTVIINTTSLTGPVEVTGEIVNE